MSAQPRVFLGTVQRGGCALSRGFSPRAGQTLPSDTQRRESPQGPFLEDLEQQPKGEQLGAEWGRAQSPVALEDLFKPPDCGVVPELLTHPGGTCWEMFPSPESPGAGGPLLEHSNRYSRVKDGERALYQIKRVGLYFRLIVRFRDFRSSKSIDQGGICIFLLHSTRCFCHQQLLQGCLSKTGKD